MSVNNSIDKLKRIALSEIIDNLGTNIPSAHIITKLREYIKYGSSSSLALSTLFNPNTHFPIKADLQAKTLLAYLNLYSQYVINSSNIETIDSLSNIALSKYKYIFLKYKELNSLFQKKKLEKSFRYTQYIDFSTPTSIYPTAFSNSVFGLSNILQLNYKDMLSLPVISEKIVYPDMLYSYIDDSTISSFSYKSDNSNIYATIDRKYGSHIGTINNIKTVLASEATSGDVTFSGQLNGFIASTIYFKVIESTGQLLTYSTSLDGLNWSNTNSIYSIGASALYVLDAIDTGLVINVNYLGRLIKDDIFMLELNYILLQDPACHIKAVFNDIYNISYLSLNDISSTILSMPSTGEVLFQETETDKTIVPIVQIDTQNIIPINNKIYSIDFKVSQDTGTISSNNEGGIVHRYNIDMADLKGVSNSYYKVGSIIFEPTSVEGISHISLDALSSVQSPVNGNVVSDSLIMYSIILETDYGMAEIPILPKDYYIINSSYVTGNTYYASEPLIFNQSFSNSGSLLYDLKFNFIQDSQYNKNALYELNPYSISASGGTFISNNQSPGSYSYREKDKIRVTIGLNKYYAYFGKIFIGTMHNIIESNLASSSNWSVMDNRTAYMFYKDTNGDIQLSVKMQGDGNESNLLFPFTGKVYGKISMMSSTKSHISPYIFNYSLGMI